MQQQKVILYMRVGKENRVTGVATINASIEGQKQALLKYCEQQQLNAITHFEDMASSGSFNRPGINDMLAFIGNNEQGIKQILVTHWDRFSRSVLETIGMQTQLAELGIEVIAINQSQLTLSDYLDCRSHECEFDEVVFKIHKDNICEFASIIAETDMEYSMDSEGDDYVLIEMLYDKLNAHESHIIKRLVAIEEKQGTACEIVNSNIGNATNQKSMKQRAIIYLRVANNEQTDKEPSLAYQEEMLRKYCQHNNIEVVAIFKEDYDAKTFNRPEFKKLLAFIGKNSNIADMLLFLKWDRFSCNAPEAYRMIAKLHMLGIEPQAVEQPLDLDIPEQKFLLALYLTSPEIDYETAESHIDNPLS